MNWLFTCYENEKIKNLPALFSSFLIRDSPSLIVSMRFYPNPIIASKKMLSKFYIFINVLIFYMIYNFFLGCIGIGITGIVWNWYRLWPVNGNGEKTPFNYSTVTFMKSVLFLNIIGFLLFSKLCYCCFFIVPMKLTLQLSKRAYLHQR